MMRSEICYSAMGRARIIHETHSLINYNARFSYPPAVSAMRTDDFDFELPERLIAQHPPARRGASRLLQVGQSGLKDGQFADLMGLVREHDLLVLNDTRVLKARLFGEKESGGKVEVLVERVLDEYSVLAQVRASKTPRADSRLLLAERLWVRVLGREGEFFRLRFEGEETGARPAGTLRPFALASLHHPCRRGRGRRTLPDRVCARAGRGGGAHGRAAFQ